MNATQDRCNSRSAFCLLLIFLCVLIPATSRADIQCYQCHGTSTGSDYRPIDAASRNYSTGGFIGNHRSHMAGPAHPSTCIKCHNNQNYTSNHRSGFINFSSNINSSPLKGKYLIGGSQITSKAQSTSPILGTCTDVNCHFEAVTPQWGTELFTAPTDCNKCHGAPPSGGATGASGSHAKHDQYYSGVTNCQKCHSNNTTFQHATSAGKRNLNISFAAAPNNGGGAYSGTVNDYLPSQNPTGTGGFGSCTATYCHSPGNKASGFDPPAVVPAWGGAALTCKSCHRSDFASGASMSSGSHGGHVNKFGGGYNTIKCVKCHALSAKADMTVFDTSNHVNGQIEIAFNNSSSAVSGYYKGILATPGSPMTKTPGLTTGGLCTNIYCHSTGQGANGTWPPTYKSPAWGTGSTGDCGTCHGNPFLHVFGGTSPLTSGSHTKHLQYQMNITNRDYERCIACHSYERAGFNPLTCSSALCHSPTLLKHANYEVNVGIPTYFGATATYNGTTKPGDGYSTCANVYCHSDGLATPVSYSTPTWGNPTSGACGTCHGAKADSPPASVPHAEHVGSSGLYLFACSQCHTGIVKYGTSSATYALISTTAVPGAIDGSKLHVNKTRNVRFGAGNPFGTYSSATQSCRNVYCHSTGNISVAAGNLPATYNGKVYARQTWSGMVSCNSCHGRSTANGMPDYANAGAAGSATVNSHQKHVTTNAIACVECHEKTTKSGTVIRGTIPSKHVNGSSADIFFNLSGSSATGTYTSATKTCNTIACHSNGRGTFMPAQWGTAATCDYCHPIASLGGSHAKHIDLSQTPGFYNYTANNSTNSTHDFGCSNCHPLSGVMHTNGVIALDLRPVAGSSALRAKNSASITTFGTAGPANNGTTADSISKSVVKCLNIYCHSNGYSANTVFATTPNWYGGVFSGDRCAACHGNSPNSTISGSPAHYSSNFDGAGNPGGHIVGIHYDNIFTGTNGLATPGGLSTSSHGNPTTSTSLNCDNCHFATVDSRANDKNAFCTSCHNGANLRGDAVIANRMTHVNGRPDVVFDAIQVRTKAQMLPQTNYTSVFTRVVGYKVNGAYDIAKTAFDTATMWDSSTKTCSNISCHFNKPITWGNIGTANKCLICHDNM